MSILDKEQIITGTINSHVFTKKVDSDKAYLVVLSDIHQGANHREYRTKESFSPKIYDNVCTSVISELVLSA